MTIRNPDETDEASGIWLGPKSRVDRIEVDDESQGELQAAIRCDGCHGWIPTGVSYLSVRGPQGDRWNFCPADARDIGAAVETLLDLAESTAPRPPTLSH